MTGDLIEDAIYGRYLGYELTKPYFESNVLRSLHYSSQNLPASVVSETFLIMHQTEWLNEM